MRKHLLILLFSGFLGQAQNPLLTNTTWYLTSLETGGNTLTPPYDLTAPYVPLYFMPQEENLQLMTSHCNVAMTGNVVFTGTESFSYDFCTATLGMCANLGNTGFDGLYMSFFMDNINNQMAYAIVDNGSESSLVITAPSGNKAYYGTALAGLDRLRLNSLSVWPNPTLGEINLNMANPAAGTLALFNTLGQQVWAADYNLIPETIDVSTLTSGIYTLKLTVDGRTQSTKIVKM